MAQNLAVMEQLEIQGHQMDSQTVKLSKKNQTLKARTGIQ